MKANDIFKTKQKRLRRKILPVIMLTVLMLCLSAFFLHSIILTKIEIRKIKNRLVKLEMKYENYAKKVDDLIRKHNFLSLRQNYQMLPLALEKTIGQSNKNSRFRRSSNSAKSNLDNSARKKKTQQNNDHIVAAQFTGTQPDYKVQKSGIVGSWVRNDNATKNCGLSRYHLNDQWIEITEAALYFIFAQIHYTSWKDLNSFSIISQSEGSPDLNLITSCTSVYSSTCYTGTVQYLNKYDRIFINQTEVNRSINFREGFSYIGIVRLSTVCN